MTIGHENAMDVIEQLEPAAARIETPCADGTPIVWRRWGTGRPLVLLHGGAGSWLHWIRNIQALARTRSVWVPDLPGFGDSGAPAEQLDADSIAPLMAEGLSSVLGSEKFDLVGFSFGGLVAAYVAAAQPANLERLVLVSVAGMGIAGSPPAMKSLRGLNAPAERREAVRHNLRAMMFHDPAAADDLAVEIQERSVARERAKGRKLVLTDALFSLSPRWNCAAFGMWAREDVLYKENFEALVAASQRLGLRERVIVEGCGHWMPFERPELFNAQLEQLLQLR